jgi:hypothetical protein
MQQLPCGLWLERCQSFDFKSEENVDCVVCHDTTGNYKKPALAWLAMW